MRGSVKTLGPQSRQGDLVVGPLFLEALALTASSCSARRTGYGKTLRVWQPGEADAALALYAWRKGRPGEAAALLTEAFTDWRHNPWAMRELMERALQLGKALGTTPETAAQAFPIFSALSREFSVGLLETERASVQLEIARQLDRGGRGRLARAIVAEFEPNAPWAAEFLRLRADIYREAGDERSERADADLRRFRRVQERPFVYVDREAVPELRMSGPSSAAPGWNEPVHAREP